MNGPAPSSSGALGGGGAFETTVTRTTGVCGTLSVDAEAGRVTWVPGVDEEDFQLEEDGEACGGCLTWDGAHGLPLEVSSSDLVGALPSDPADPRTSQTHPSFEVLHAVATEGDPGRRVLHKTDPFLCTHVGQLDDCVDQLRRAAGHAR